MSRVERRIYVVGTVTILVLVAQIAILRSILGSIDLRVPLVPRLVMTSISVVPALLGGILLWFIVGWIRRDWRGYAHAIRSREWIVTTVLIIPVNILATYFYAVLKNSVPLLTGRIYDQFLWNLDRGIFFGLSPNIFFLNLFSADWLLRVIDYGYGHIFFVAITLAYPVFFAHRRNEWRVAFFAGSTAMWSAGAWLYYAVPSIGPCYKFYSVWEPVKKLFPDSTYWQSQLIQNYEKVLQVRHGVIDRSIDLFEGIGAFPSLHVAFHVFLALWLWRLSRHWGLVGWLAAAIIFIGSVVTGWHYLVDSLAGALMGALAYAISVMLLRWISGATADSESGQEQSLAG